MMVLCGYRYFINTYTVVSLQLIYPVYLFKPNEIINLIKNSNELTSLKTAIQMKRNQLYSIEEKIKQYQA